MGSIWLVYTLDHLFDGYKLKNQAVALRHRWHYQARNFLIPICIAVFTLLAYLGITRVDEQVLKFGAILAALTLIHFLINFRNDGSKLKKVFLKEPMIAVVTALGFAGVPLLHQDLSFENILPVFIIFCINLANLWLFSFYSHEEDENSGLLSGSTVVGLFKIRKFAGLALFVALMSLGSAMLFTDFPLVQLQVLVWMIFVLVLIAFYTRFFGQRDRYRFWGDLIFCIPGVFYALSL